MDLALGLAAWEAAIADLDPAPKQRRIDPRDLAALESPATLAAHLTPRLYFRREHTDLAARMIAQAESRVDSQKQGPRLVIDMPPQCGKTESTVIWAVFWWLCKNPAAKLMIISYGIELAVERGDRVKKLVEEFGHRYGLKLDPSTRAKHRWKVLTGGAVRCFGIRTGITGNPADAIWIDDPIKSRAEADSTTFRRALHNAYSGDVLSRLAPGAPVFIIATRWHIDDLSGRRVAEEGLAKNGGRWEQLHLPAICDGPDDPLGRAPGEPLPHYKIAEGDIGSLLRHWEEKKHGSGTTARDWASLYQGDPKPAEGALLTWELMRERRCFERGTCVQPKRIGVGVDPSGGGRDVAGIIGGFLGDDDKMYYTHDWSGVMGSDLWARKACELAAQIDADCFVVEKNFGGDMAMLMLRTAWNELRRENPERYSVFCPRIIVVTSRKGKYLRAEPIAQQFIEAKAFTAAYLPDFEGEWCTWQAGSKESPGRIDAGVHLANELLPMPMSGQAEVVDPLTLGNVDLIGRLSPGDMGLLR